LEFLLQQNKYMCARMHTHTHTHVHVCMYVKLTYYTRKHLRKNRLSLKEGCPHAYSNSTPPSV